MGCPELAESHAVLLEPPSRNYVANKAGNENCPHCLQGGGPTQVKARGTGVWPTYLEPSSHGICGDPVQSRPDPASLASSPYMKHKIPEDLSCTHCTLQWYWSTGNTCLYDADYLGPDGYFQRNSGAFQALGWNAAEWCPFCVSSWATCGNACCKTGGTFGEEFWNCADIAVSASGSGGGGSSPTPAPTMQTTTVRPTTMTTTAPTTATTTQEGGGGGSTGTTCRARAGNVLSATDAKCTTACAYLPAGTWPCTVDGPCDCSPEPAPEPAPEPEPEPASTTAATTAAPTTTAAPNCVGAWGKCGGKNWAGASCCVSGYRCNFQNEWYSQCIPR